MSYNNQYSGLVAMALILFTAGIPLAYGQIGSIPVAGITAMGNLINPGNCSTSLAGIPVNLTCINNRGVPVLVGQNTTNANGSFSISVPNLQMLLGNPLSIIPLLNINIPILQQLIQLVQFLLQTLLQIQATIPCTVSAVSPIINPTLCPGVTLLNRTVTARPDILIELINTLAGATATVKVVLNANVNTTAGNS